MGSRLDHLWWPNEPYRHIQKTPSGRNELHKRLKIRRITHNLPIPSRPHINPTSNRNLNVRNFIIPGRICRIHAILTPCIHSHVPRRPIPPIILQPLHPKIYPTRIPCCRCRSYIASFCWPIQKDNKSEDYDRDCFCLCGCVLYVADYSCYFGGVCGVGGYWVFFLLGC